MILSGWKQIANHLGCGVRTAQRWEAHALPVRRPVPGKRSHVVADSDEIDLWLADSTLRTKSTPPNWLQTFNALASSVRKWNAPGESCV
jgi:hypothetical protein